MKEKRLLEALSEVEDRFVEEIDTECEAVVNTKDVKSKSVRCPQKWIAVAAILVVVFVIGGQFLHKEDTNQNQFAASVRDGMVTLEDGAILFTKNPWKDNQDVTKYPVYKNLSYLEGAGGAPCYFTKEELMEIAEDTAQKLETEITAYEMDEHLITDVETRSDVYQITAQTELADIRVSGNGQISVFFHEAVALSEEYRFSSDNTYSEAVKLTYYLTEKYNDLFGFEQAAEECAISYDFDGNRTIYYGAYNMISEEALTEYCFKHVSFYGDENGLTMMHYGDVRAASEYVGAYSVISEAEARVRLEEGQYFSIYLEEESIGGSFSDENIRLVELTYLTGSNCQYYQPYYCFYVESEGYVEGIANYGLFFVPALADEDLEQFEEGCYFLDSRQSLVDWRGENV